MLGGAGEEDGGAEPFKLKKLVDPPEGAVGVGVSVGTAETLLGLVGSGAALTSPLEGAEDTGNIMEGLL